MFKTKKIKGFLIALMLVIVVNVSAGFWDTASADIPPDPPAQEGQQNQSQDDEPEDIGETLLKVKSEKENTNNAKTTKELVEEAANKATKVHRFFAPLINYFAFQIGNFLGNDYVYQGAMGDMLQKIWVISRNLVNIAFVFYLLWIAVQTIFKQEGGLDELKKNLIVFTLALIAVNFSWLATKVVLDAASVVTHAVFAIPSGIGDPPQYEPCQVNTSDKQPLKGVCYPTKIIAPADAGNKSVLYWKDEDGENDECSAIEKRYIGEETGDILTSAYFPDGTINDAASPENEALQGRVSMCMESLNLFKYDQNTAVIYLTYGMARIQNLVNATASGGDAVQLAVGVLMSILLQIIYGIALGALFVALIIRMLMLWILVAFSPFIILVMGLTRDGGDAGEVGKHLSISNFISWAFVPAKVGAVFVVAFIMISAGQSMGNISATVIDKLSSTSGFTFKILGQESLFAGIGSLQDFLWLLMTIAILWMGVFAVLGKLEVVGNWFSRIGEAGKELAVKAGSLPYWAPIIPLGKGGQKISLKGALSTVTGISALNKKYAEANSGGGIVGGGSKISQNIKKLKYEDYKNKVLGGSFNPNDAKKMAEELGYPNLAELMKEGPDHIKAEIRRMPGAEGIGESELNRFYGALEKANGGPAIKEGEAESSPAAPASAAVGGAVATGATGAEGEGVGGVKEESDRAKKAGGPQPPKPGPKPEDDELKKISARENIEDLTKAKPDDTPEIIQARQEVKEKWLEAQKALEEKNKKVKEFDEKFNKEGISDAEKAKLINEKNMAEYEHLLAANEEYVSLDKLGLRLVDKSILSPVEKEESRLKRSEFLQASEKKLQDLKDNPPKPYSPSSSPQGGSSSGSTANPPNSNTSGSNP